MTKYGRFEYGEYDPDEIRHADEIESMSEEERIKKETALDSAIRVFQFIDGKGAWSIANYIGSLEAEERISRFRRSLKLPTKKHQEPIGKTIGIDQACAILGIERSALVQYMHEDLMETDWTEGTVEQQLPTTRGLIDLMPEIFLHEERAGTLERIRKTGVPPLVAQELIDFANIKETLFMTDSTNFV